MGTGLVVTRRVGESLLIGDTVTVTVQRIRQGGVRLRIEAPAEVDITRPEARAETCGDPDARISKTPTTV